VKTFTIIIGFIATLIGSLIAYNTTGEVSTGGIAIATFGAAVMSSGFMMKNDDDRD
jgi:hypothetical protein